MKLRYDEIIGTEILGTDIFTIVLYTTSGRVELKDEKLHQLYVNVTWCDPYHFNSRKTVQLAHDFIRNKVQQEHNRVKKEQKEHEEYLYEVIYE